MIPASPVRAQEGRAGIRRPERRCVACGVRRPQCGLVRLRVEERSGAQGNRPWVRVDRVGEERAGRGAYLCPRWACLERALHKRMFSRVFRQTVAIDDMELRAAFSVLLEEIKEQSGR